MFFLKRKRKRYEDKLGLKLVQQPFPGNGARKLIGYFNDCEKDSASAQNTIVAFPLEKSIPRVSYPHGMCVH